MNDIEIDTCVFAQIANGDGTLMARGRLARQPRPVSGRGAAYRRARRPAACGRDARAPWPFVEEALA